jgi:hypothetical protein
MEGIMRQPLLTSAVAAFLAANALPAAAQSRNPVFTADKEACFGRAYDRAHMASHPDQKATSLYVSRWLGHRPEAENWTPDERANEIKRFRETGETSVMAFVTFRDRPGNFSNSLTCNKEGSDGVTCAIECDGGSFKLKRENANTALLTNNGFVVVGGCGEDIDEKDTVHFSPGKDDKVFRLDSKDLAACRAEEQKVSPIPAGKPLRERFKEDEAFCFGRDYDAAHLRGNPQQMVASLRVGRLDPAGEKDPNAGGETWWWFNVKLSVSLTLKTGGGAGGTRYSCYPEDGSWGCRRESTTDEPSACNDRNIQLVRGPGDEILVQNRFSGLPIDNECEKEPTGEQYPRKVPTRTDDKLFRLSRMPVEACR